MDLGDALAVEFDRGAVGTLDSTGAVVAKQAEILQCRVFGDAGHLQIDATEGWATVHREDGDVVRLGQLPEAERYPVAGPAHNLVGVTVGAERCMAPGVLGQRVVELLDGALRSARERRTIELEPLDDV